MDTGQAAIRLRLSKAQVALIWPGLDHIVRAFLTWEKYGQAVTSYPFRIQDVPSGVDSGTLSSDMMDCIKQLWIKLRAKAKAETDARIQIGAFELRAAILAARITLKLHRVKTHGNLKSRIDAIKSCSLDGEPISLVKRKVQDLIKRLERYTKRANRRLLRTGSRDEFKSRSKEWRSHVLWIRFHLAYFKPFGSPFSRRWEKANIDQLVVMAEKAIKEKGFAIPEAKTLRHLIRLFVRYSVRGRLDAYDHRYMLRNAENRLARFFLFQFLEPRLNLRRAT